MAKKALSILICTECENPLSVGSTGSPQSGYCTTCDYPPSMQDTAIAFYCPGCRVELTKMRCGICGTEYER